MFDSKNDIFMILKGITKDILQIELNEEDIDREIINGVIDTLEKEVLLLSVEEDFNFKISKDKFNEIKTYRDLINLISDHFDIKN